MFAGILPIELSLGSIDGKVSNVLFVVWVDLICYRLYIIKLYRIRFMFHLMHLNHGILYNLFYVYFADRYKVDVCLAHNISEFS